MFNEVLSSLFSTTLSNIFNDKAFSDYFQGNVNSPNLYELASDFAFNTTLSNFNFQHVLLGCPSNFLQITLEPGKIYNLDLSNKIKNGKLIYINYTPQGDGNLVPIELHGNTPMNNEYSTIKKLYPYLADNSKTPLPTNVNILYVYVPEKIVNDISFKQISEAFQCYFNNEYVDSIIKLQIAAEFILGKFLSNYGNKYKRYSYFENLKTNLNEIITQNSFLPCPQFLIDSLDAMRNKRNDIIHEGGNITLNQNEVRTWCVNTLFFIKYFKVIHKI